MSDLIVTKDLVQSFINSGDRFPVDFDNAWQWLGYSTKQKAKNRLIDNFESGIDYTINLKVKRVEGNRGGGSVRYEEIRLTVDCFKELGMLAGTEQGKLVRKYYLECERIVKEVIPAQQDDIWHWKARAMEAEERLIAKKEAVNNMYPAHIAGMILGARVEVPVVEKPTIEVIDDRHNTRFTGQTLAQINDYLKTRYGIKKFKSGADLKRYLERTGKADLIAQTLRSIASDYVPEENLEALYEAILQGDRQQFLGEN